MPDPDPTGVEGGYSGRVDEAGALLATLQRERGFALGIVDIESDAALLARYRDQIPVVLIDNRLELAAPLSESELRAALK